MPNLRSFFLILFYFAFRDFIIDNIIKKISSMPRQPHTHAHERERGRERDAVNRVLGV